MGLSSKQQVSRDGLDWSQDLLKNSPGLENPKPPAPARQQRQLKLRCPRCDSTNTKFCYYNNYSKLQPRHFCKACRRHWTNGGILRNVPVGGGRKNKRSKTSHQSTLTLASDHVNSNVQLFQQQTLPSDFSIDSGGGGGLMGSLPSLPPVAQFTSITAAAIDRSNHFSNPAAFFSSFLDFTGQDTAEVGDFNTITSSIAPWQQMLPSASANINSSLNGLDLSSSFWSCWDDLTGLVSPDLKHPISP